jgi:hypothetical protein
MHMSTPTRGDASAALVAAMLFLTLGLFAIFDPDGLRTAMDNVVNALHRRTWHPYRMPIPVLQIVVGSVGIVGAAILIYIAYMGLGR